MASEHSDPAHNSHEPIHVPGGGGSSSSSGAAGDPDLDDGKRTPPLSPAELLGEMGHERLPRLRINDIEKQPMDGGFRSPGSVMEGPPTGHVAGGLNARVRKNFDFTVAIFPAQGGSTGQRITAAAAEEEIRRIVGHDSQPKVFFDAAENAHLRGDIPDPEEEGVISATCAFFARLGCKDKRRLLAILGVEVPDLSARRLSRASHAVSEHHFQIKPGEDSKSQIDFELCRMWNSVVYDQRARCIDALRQWQKEDPAKWELSCGGLEGAAGDWKKRMLTPPSTGEAKMRTEVIFGDHNPVFVRFASPNKEVNEANARRLIQKLNGSKLCGQIVQVDLALSMKNLLQVAGRRQFHKGDLIDRHALNKALMWVWGNRDELIPDTIQQEITKDNWDTAWRHVLAAKLRCSQDSEWITQFTFAFPETGPSGDSGPKRDPQLVRLVGEASDAAKGAWLGEREFLRRVYPKPRRPETEGIPDDLLDLPYTYGLHVGGSLQQYEQELASEAYKILCEVFTSLDSDGGGRIDRSELNDFFSNDRDEKGLSRPVWRTNAEWEDYCDQTDMPGLYRHSEARQGKGEEQKIKMDADREREQDELRERATAMKEKLFEDQKRACCLNMTDKQFKHLLRALMEEEHESQDRVQRRSASIAAGEGANFDAPNFWMSDAEFPAGLEGSLRKEEQDRFAQVTIDVDLPAHRTLSAEELLNAIGIELFAESNTINKVHADREGTAVHRHGLAAPDKEDRLEAGWQLYKVGHSRVCGRRGPGLKGPGTMVREQLEHALSEVQGSSKVTCVFREHFAYCVNDGLPTDNVFVDESAAVVNKKGRRHSKAKTADENTIIEKYIIRGEFDKISFGLPQKILDRLHIPDPELVRAAGFIVSDEDRSRLELKAKEHNISPAAHALIFGTMISQKEFKKAYESAVGVDLDSDDYCHVWEHISNKFGGMIDKEIFFRFARTEPAEPVHPGVGGSYYVAFCQEQKAIVNLEQNLVLFTLFLLCFALQIVIDRGIGEAHYQASALEETIIQEIGGGSEHADGGTWYPWYFYDVRQLEEWWQWSDMWLDLAYPSQGGETGIKQTWEHSNMIVGGIKVQQWRVKPEQCRGMDLMWENEMTEACYRGIDASLVTDGLITSGQSSTAAYPWIPRTAQTYMTNFIRTDPVCLIDSTPTSFPQTVRVGVIPRDSNRVTLEVFKWLAEERLNVRVEIVELTWRQALQGLLDGTVDAVLGVWDLFHVELRDLKASVRAAIASGSLINGGSVGHKGDTGIWINAAGAAACPGCTRWETLKYQSATFSNGCTNACRHACSRCGLSFQSTLTTLADCTTCPTSLPSAAATAYTAACSATATTCAAGKGAIWDLHPGVDEITFGPEMYRSSTLDLSSKFELVYAVSEADLKQRVTSAAGPMAFVLSDPDLAVIKSGAKRVSLPEYDADSCATPSTMPNDPAMETSFPCDVPKNDLVKLFRSELMSRIPQIAWLIESLSLSKDDIDTMLTSFDANNWGYDVVACDWLKSKPGTWENWVRQTRPTLAEKRRVQYYDKCFGNWAGINDDESFTNNARYLSSIQSASELEGLTGICSGDTSALVQPACRKVLKAPSEDPADSLVMPTREEWFQLGHSAIAGNLTAERLYDRLEPWMYQTCRSFVAIQGRMPSYAQATPLQHYPCDGYIAHFPISWTRERALRHKNELFKNNWIDVATRAIMLELVVYNQQTQLFVRARYLGEIANSGGWEMSQQKAVFRLWQWENKALSGKVGMILLIVTTLGFTIYFTVVTSQTMLERWKWRVRDHRSLDASAGHNAWCPFHVYGVFKLLDMLGTVLGSVGDVCDIANYVMMYITWAMRFYVMGIGLTVENMLCTDTYPDDLNTVADVMFIVTMLDGVNAILVVLRLLFFLSIFPSVKQILGTIVRAGSEIAWLLITFVLIVFGFALCGWVVFGSNVKKYNGLGESIVTLIFMTTGEVDYESLDAERPGFAFFFFFFFFILVTCILFNLIIAVIGNAYDAEKATFFDTDGFMERVRHDPETAAWGADQASGFTAWMRFGPVTREMRYQWGRCVYRWHKCTKGRCMGEKGCCGEYNMRRALQQNPRVFWAEYMKLMEGLSSDNLCIFLRAHTRLRMLVKNSKVHQTLPVSPYREGDSVWVRDNDDDEWLKGQVTQLDGETALVLPCGWDANRTKRDDDEGMNRRKGYEWKYVVVDDHDYKEGDFVMTTQDIAFADALEVVGDEPSGDPVSGRGEKGDGGKARVKAVLLRGTLCSIDKVMESPIAGKPVWQAGWKARVRVRANQTDRWHTRQGTSWEMAGRRRATEGIDRARALHQCVFVCDRSHIMPMRARLDKRDEDIVESADLQLLRVHCLLEEELHEQLDEIGFFLVALPQKVLGGNLTRSWMELLTHFHFWKSRVKSYTKLDKESDDLIEETHAWCRDRFRELAEDINHIRHGPQRKADDGSGGDALARGGSIPGLNRTLQRFRDELMGQTVLQEGAKHSHLDLFRAELVKELTAALGKPLPPKYAPDADQQEDSSG